MTTKEIKKHLTRNKMLTSTLLKIMQEFKEDDSQYSFFHERESRYFGLDSPCTVFFIFMEDNGNGEIAFEIDGALAVKIEDTFNP